MPGEAELNLPIPNEPGILGITLYLQAAALDPGANSGGFITSDRLTWVVGDAN